MRPEEREMLMSLKERLDAIEKYDRYYLKRDLYFENGKKIVATKQTGLYIGSETSQKLAFYGVTPVDQPATISDPSGGATQDAEARTAIVALIDRLQELGLIA